MSVSITSQIPALTSSNISEFIHGLISAALKGMRIFITASVYEKLKPLFEELGIQVREVSGKINLDTYILIKSSGIKVKIEVYEAGKRVNSITTTIKALEKTLKEYVEKKKGGNKEGPSYYEMILPEEFKISLEGIGEGEGEDES